MTYIRFSKENNERIAKAGEIARKSAVNDVQRKLRAAVARDEHAKINKYHEGYCYGCGKIDQTISSLFYACPKCLQKRGVEGLLAIVAQKNMDELCDFCETYRLGVKQINCSLCKTCMHRVHEVHTRYQKAGGVTKIHPYYRMLRRKYGKDYMLYVMPGRKVGI